MNGERVGVCVTRPRNWVSMQRGEPSDSGARCPACTDSLSTAQHHRSFSVPRLPTVSFYISNLSILRPIGLTLGVKLK
jgi:hypothetical protein